MHARNTPVQLLALYIDHETQSHNAQRHRQTDRRQAVANSRYDRLKNLHVKGTVAQREGFVLDHADCRDHARFCESCALHKAEPGMDALEC